MGRNPICVIDLHEIFRLREDEHWTVREIAKELEMSMSTVNRYLREGKDNLPPIESILPRISKDLSYIVTFTVPKETDEDYFRNSLKFYVLKLSKVLAARVWDKSELLAKA